MFRCFSWKTGHIYFRSFKRQKCFRLNQVNSLNKNKKSNRSRGISSAWASFSGLSDTFKFAGSVDRAGPTYSLIDWSSLSGRMEIALHFSLEDKWTLLKQEEQSPESVKLVGSKYKPRQHLKRSAVSWDPRLHFMCFHRESRRTSAAFPPAADLHSPLLVNN